MADLLAGCSTSTEKWNTKPFVFVKGPGISLYGMMAAVLAKGWSSHVSGTNEAYIVLNLGQRMHVKVVTTIGRLGSYSLSSMASHFIGLYD